MISENQKKEILKQIDDFVNKQERSGAQRLYEYRWYVPTNIAIDRAGFFGEIYKHKKINCNRIIDLTFGSANLTSHLFLDNDIEFKELVLNDKNIDDANFSDETKGLAKIVKEITDNDILNSDLFNIVEPYNVVVFNPQFGGDSYPDGELGIKRLRLNEEFVFYRYKDDVETAFNDKFDLKGCTLLIDSDLKKISIHSDASSMNDLQKQFNQVKVFNYYDIFYQDKTSQTKGEVSNLVKFRKTLNKITDDNTTIVFYGKKDDYKLFFSDFNECNSYLAKDIDKSLFIGQKNDTNLERCYKKEDSNFIEINCENQIADEGASIDLEKVMKDIDQDLTDLKSLDGGELPVLENKLSLSTKDQKPTKPPFKNFLFNLYRQGN